MKKVADSGCFEPELYPQSSGETSLSDLAGEKLRQPRGGKGPKQETEVSSTALPRSCHLSDFFFFFKENGDLPVNGAPNSTNPRSTINKAEWLVLSQG